MNKLIALFILLTSSLISSMIEKSEIITITKWLDEEGEVYSATLKDGKILRTTTNDCKICTIRTILCYTFSDKINTKASIKAIDVDLSNFTNLKHWYNEDN